MDADMMREMACDSPQMLHGCSRLAILFTCDCYFDDSC